MATTTTPLTAIARSIGSSAKRSLCRQAPPRRSSMVGNGPPALRLVDAGHQLSPARRPQEVDFAHLELELRRGIVGHLHARPPLASLSPARSGGKPAAIARVVICFKKLRRSVRCASMPTSLAVPLYLRPIATEISEARNRRGGRRLLGVKCHLDLKAGWLRLEPGETKNNEAGCSRSRRSRGVATSLGRQRARAESVAKATGQIIPWLEGLIPREGGTVLCVILRAPDTLAAHSPARRSPCLSWSSLNAAVQPAAGYLPDFNHSAGSFARILSG
jgi:hypothetical protein